MMLFIGVVTLLLFVVGQARDRKRNYIPEPKEPVVIREELTLVWFYLVHFPMLGLTLGPVVFYVVSCNLPAYMNIALVVMGVAFNLFVIRRITIPIRCRVLRWWHKDNIR